MQIFGREPTLWLAVISSLIGVVGSVGLGFITGPQAALIVVALNALFAAINAYAVRPISPVAFTYAVGSIIAVFGSYGLHIPDTTVVMINSSVIPLLALLSRGQVSPVETSISKITPDPLPEAAAASDVELDDWDISEGDPTIIEGDTP